MLLTTHGTLPSLYYSENDDLRRQASKMPELQAENESLRQRVSVSHSSLHPSFVSFPHFASRSTNAAAAVDPREPHFLPRWLVACALDAQLKLVEDESDLRFEQVKMDSLRLAEVWESEKRRLQDEVSRQRELVEVERENAVRVREQMST